MTVYWMLFFLIVSAASFSLLALVLWLHRVGLEAASRKKRVWYCRVGRHEWRSIAQPYVRQCRSCGQVEFDMDGNGNFPDGLREYVEDKSRPRSISEYIEDENRKQQGGMKHV